jgi:hypothetical protein
MRDKRNNNHLCFGGKPEGKLQLEDLGLDGRTVLKWILIK